MNATSKKGSNKNPTKASIKQELSNKVNANSTGAVAQGSNLLGSFVMYDVDGCSIEYAELEKLFDSVGLDHKYLPEGKIRPENALKKVRARINGRKRSLGVLMEMLPLSDGSRLLYGIVDPSVDQTKEELTYDHAITVELDKATGKVKINNKLGDAHAKIGQTTADVVIKQVEDMFAEFSGRLISRDITRMTMKALEQMHYVRLRFGGGTYFVAPTHQDDLNKLHQVFDSISKMPRHSMNLYAITDEASNRDSITKAARSQTADKIETMKAEIEKFKERIKLGNLTSRTLETKIKEFRLLKEEVKVLADALMFNAEDITDEITETQNELKAMMMSVVDDKEAEDKDAKKEKGKSENAA